MKVLSPCRTLQQGIRQRIKLADVIIAGWNQSKSVIMNYQNQTLDETFDEGAKSARTMKNKTSAQDGKRVGLWEINHF